MALLLGGCWQDDLVDGTFTRDQWAFIETFARVGDRPPRCAQDEARILDCGAAVALGDQLFHDDQFSDPSTGPTDTTPPVRVSCATCHVAPSYADHTPASIGVGTTARNTISLLDVAYRRDEFTWSGAIELPDGTWRYDSLENTLSLPIESAAAMHTTPDEVARSAIYSLPAKLFYEQAFGPVPSDPDLASVYDRVELALAAYERTLVTGPSPFDRYVGAVDGDVGDPGALGDAARRGLALFTGRGLCSECHHGPAFADDEFHNTGVGTGAPDRGRSNEGRFRTPTLRNVAITAPYMHGGQIQTLAQVVEFYRWGGDDAGFVGTKDTLIEPLAGLTADDLADLVAFLDALTSCDFLEDPAACGS